jgi:hypothetical protein
LAVPSTTNTHPCLAAELRPDLSIRSGHGALLATLSSSGPARTQHVVISSRRHLPSTFTAALSAPPSAATNSAVATERPALARKSSRAARRSAELARAASCSAYCVGDSLVHVPCFLYSWRRRPDRPSSSDRGGLVQYSGQPLPDPSGRENCGLRMRSVGVANGGTGWVRCECSGLV